MEIGLQKSEMLYYRNTASGGTTCEAGAEMVVPDVFPDIGEIVSAAGTPLLRSKTLADGRIILSGSIQTRVLFLPEDEGVLRKLEMEIPFSISQEVSTPEDSLSTVSVRLAYMDAHALNPRKLSVRCELCAEYDCYAPSSFTLVSGQLPEHDSEVCLRKETAEADVVCGVFEKAFIVTDAYPLSGAKSAASELLSHTVRLSAEDVKYVGTKMILKGIVQTELLWQTEEGELCTSAFSSGFSQILDVGEQNASAAEAVLTLSGAYYELLFSANETRNVTAELHVLAQVVCTRHTEIPYISDIYSNCYPIQPVFGEPERFAAEERETVQDGMRGLIETPYTVREVLQTSADVGIWSETENGFTCPVNVRLILRDEDGSLHGLLRSFAAKWECQRDENMHAALRAVQCPELFSAPGSGGAEVRLLVSAELIRRHIVRLTPLEAVTAEENARIDLSQFPSITVLPGKEADLWALAKQYHSTVALIEAANRDLETSVLLIPRVR